MQSYVIVVSVVAGVSVFAVLVYLVLKIYRKREEGGTDAETKGLCPPSIIVTSSSPSQSKKQLYSPAQRRATSKENEEKVAKRKKKERSVWHPPKKTKGVPIITATLVQPTVVERSKVRMSMSGFSKSANWGHYFYVSEWRRDSHFACSSEPREGVAACSAKRVPSFLTVMLRP